LPADTSSRRSDPRARSRGDLAALEVLEGDGGLGRAAALFDSIRSGALRVLLMIR
jgi:hypothetical protein